MTTKMEQKLAQPKKLELHTETLRVLNGHEVTQVAGGESGVSPSITSQEPSSNTSVCLCKPMVPVTK